MKPNNTEPHWMYAQKNPDIFKKYLHLCSTEESHKGQTGWINDSSIIIFGWPLPFFILCDCCAFFFEWDRSNGLVMVNVHVLCRPSLSVSLFPSNRSGSTSPQNHSAVIKHPPPSSIYTLPLSLSLPLLVLAFPTSIRSAFPGSQWNERRACTLTGWNRTGLGACSLSLSFSHSHTHTHPHTLTFTQTNRLSLADCSVSDGHTHMHALPCSRT